MRTTEHRKGEGRFWATAVLAVILVLGVGAVDRVPSPLAESASVDEFSATRARTVLARLLDGEAPHATGSVENDRVRQRVEDELRALGYEPSVEEALVCAEFGSCAVIRNVVAELPGRIAGPAVLLNAHYDSVAASPGAGDDGAGVASLLEVARALKHGPRPERTIRLLIDDGEEAGLLGAEAWIRNHQAEETLAVIVLEARGSSGPALLFETNAGNLALVRAYSRAVSNPATSSLFFSLYERLPNRTNFTVFKREGYAGFAAAFIESPAQYHTPLNDLGRLSDGSLQHMGAMTLSMARELSAHGLAPAPARANASYFDLLGSMVVLWPEAWNIWISVGALILVAIAVVAAIRKERASSAQVLLGWLVVLLALIASGGIGWLLVQLAELRSGDAGWIANGAFLVAASWFVAAAVVTAPYIFVRRTPAMLSIWAAVWLLYGIVGVVLSRLLPGAAYLFFIPALAAGLSGVVSLLGRQPERNEGMVVAPFLMSLLLTVPILEHLYTGLGLVALPGIAALATLELLPMLVVSTEARRPALLTAGAALGFVLCAAGFVMTPVFSAEVPRSMNLIAMHGPDGEGSAVLLGNADPLPVSLAGAADWSKQPVDAFRRSGANQAPRFWTVQMDLPDVAPPDLSSSTFVPGDGEGLLHLVVRVGDPGSVVRVQLPSGSKAIDLSCGEHTIPLSPDQGDRITLRGIPAKGCVMTAAVKAGAEVEVIEERPGLPVSVRAIAGLRTDREVPIGPGDRSLIMSRVNVSEMPRMLRVVPDGVTAAP